ncbi:MAG: DMT family transporter [Phycisphaerales bacterium]
MTTPPPDHALRETSVGVLTVALTLVGWSVTPLFIKYFAAYIDAWTSNGWRYGFSALLWSPLLVAGALRGTLPKGLWRAALVPALVNAAGQVCFTLAHYHIGPGLLTFGLRSQMVFVAVGAALLFPAERLVVRSPAFLTGVVLVMVGTIGTVAFGALGDSEKAGYALGVTLAICSGAGFAGYALAVRKYMHDIPTMTAFAAISLYTSIAMVGLMLPIAEKHGGGALDLSTRQFCVLLLSSVIGIALGHVLYYISIKRLGVAVSTGVIQLQPVCVAVLSYFTFGEVLNLAQWATGALAIAGAMLMLWIQHKLKRAAPRDREYDELPPDHVAAASLCEEEPQTQPLPADT